MKKNKNKKSTVKDCNKVNNSMKKNKNTKNTQVQDSDKAMGFDDDESHSFMLDDDNSHSFELR